MSYPWIKDSKCGSTPSVTNYLEVTSPNGLYLNSGNNNLTISNSSIQQVSLDFNTLISNGTLQTTELATNITSNFTPTEIHIGSTGETNVGTLYCRNIECGENLNVVTINGLPPVGPTGPTGATGPAGQPIYIKYAEVDSTNSNLYPSGTITFPSGVTFSSAPIVIATTNNPFIGITVTSTTQINFQYTFTGPPTGLIKINYIASVSS
jgi:hypothetical protein